MKFQFVMSIRIQKLINTRIENHIFLPPWRKISYSMTVLVRIFRHVPFPSCQQKFFLTVHMFQGFTNFINHLNSNKNLENYRYFYRFFLSFWQNMAEKWETDKLLQRNFWVWRPCSEIYILLKIVLGYWYWWGLLQTLRFPGS